MELNAFLADGSWALGTYIYILATKLDDKCVYIYIYIYIYILCMTVYCVCLNYMDCML